MDINLDRNLVFFDVETTGLNVMRDRIVQIALIKINHKDQSVEEFSTLVNPGIPISEESMAIHGITPKDLANKPTFQQLAQKIYDFIGDADLGGYNSNRFDVPMLMEEFERVGMPFDISKRRLIDAQRIFYKMEPRTLKAALKFYCDTELTDAHDALADVRATLEVFKGQLARYEGQDLHDEEGNVVPNPIKNDIAAIHSFTNDNAFVDITQRLKYSPDGKVLFNFGKHIGQPVEAVLRADRNYANWILEKEFSVQVKNYIREVVKSMAK